MNVRSDVTACGTEKKVQVVVASSEWKQDLLDRNRGRDGAAVAAAS